MYSSLEILKKVLLLVLNVLCHTSHFRNLEKENKTHSNNNNVKCNTFPNNRYTILYFHNIMCTSKYSIRWKTQYHWLSSITNTNWFKWTLKKYIGISWSHVSNPTFRFYFVQINVQNVFSLNLELLMLD